jgi:hypothetical protein
MATLSGCSLHRLLLFKTKTLGVPVMFSEKQDLGEVNTMFICTHLPLASFRVSAIGLAWRGFIGSGRLKCSVHAVNT